LNALIFDCDGVLAETERDAHLPAFNRAFAEFELGIHWTPEVYAEKLRVAGGKELLSVTISIGVAATGGEGDTPEALLKRADAAVYEAKAQGRNKVIAHAA